MTSTPTNTEEGRYDSHRALPSYRPVSPPTRRRGGTTVTEPYYSIDQYPHQHGGEEVRQSRNLTILSTSIPTNTEEGRYDSHRALLFHRPASPPTRRRGGTTITEPFYSIDQYHHQHGGGEVRQSHSLTILSNSIPTNTEEGRYDSHRALLFYRPVSPPTRRRGGTTVTEPYYSIDQYPHQHGGGEVRQSQSLTILSTSIPTNTEEGRYDSHGALPSYRPVSPPTRRRGGTTVKEPYNLIDQYPHQHGGGEVRQSQSLTTLSTSISTNTEEGRYDSHGALLFYRPVSPPTRRRGGTTVTEPYHLIDQYPHQHGGG